MSLVFDCTVLIDLREGGIMASLKEFSPPIFVCDVTVGELEKRSKKRWKRLLRGIGLKIREVPSDNMIRVLELAERYSRPSRADLFALALAEHLGAVLVTGDRDLRRAAKEEGCPVHGTLWLLDEMVTSGVLEGPAATEAVDAMLAGDRRLPAQLVSKYQKAWRRGRPFGGHEEGR